MQKRIQARKDPLLITVLAVAALMIAGTALAQGPGRGAGSGRCDGPGVGRGMGAGFGSGHRLEVLAQRLELTEEQVAAIEGIREAGQEKNMKLKKELMQLENELKGEMLKDDPSEKTALDLVKKIGALKTEMESNRLENRLEMRKQLTPEQRDKMLVMRERFKGGREGRGHHGKGRGAGCRGGNGCNGSGPGKGPRPDGDDL